MTIEVFGATHDDVPKIIDFVKQLAVYEKLENEVDFTQRQYEVSLFRKPVSPFPEALIVAADEVPIGFALFINILPSVIHLEDLFVSEKARGKGAGLRLLNQLSKIAISRGIQSLEWACLDWNEPSLKFYTSIGAQPILNRVLYRITGHALTSPKSTFSDVSEIQGSPVVVELKSDKNTWLSYTLSFTTFLATPVILVTEMHFSSEDFILLFFDYLKTKAIEKGYKRIDIRINPTNQQQLAQRLVSETHAFELSGWIPFSLSGDALVKMASSQ